MFFMNYLEFLEMMLLLGIIFIGSVQPMIMVVSLMMITLIYSKMMMEMVGSYWYSYMLVLVMMSGVLMLFTYMVSLIPNESFEVMSLVNFVLLLIMMSVKMEVINMEDGGVFSMKIWGMVVGGINLYVVIYLLIIMVMVVWLSGAGMKALRI